jgi:hypothetical protein
MQPTAFPPYATKLGEGGKALFPLIQICWRGGKAGGKVEATLAGDSSKGRLLGEGEKKQAR